VVRRRRFEKKHSRALGRPRRWLGWRLRWFCVRDAASGWDRVAASMVMGTIRARVEIGAGGLGDLGSRKREARRCLGTEEVTAAATLMVVLWPCELVVICRFMGAATMVIRGRTRLGHGGDEY
jgi:hypothetical protein